MRQIETSGKTRKDAIQAALDKLGKELHEVRVEILDEGSKGFLGLGARDVKVRVTLEDGIESDQVDTRGNDAGALLQEIIERMGMQSEVTTEFLEDGTIRLNIDSPDSAILIGRKGKTLAALQYLINRMVNTGEDPEKVERISVDIEGYVERRRDTLEEIAQRSAQRAKETGKRVRLKPLDPQERRVIHMMLQDDPDVETYSVGNAQIRSVIIQPKGMAQLSEEEADREAPPGERRGGDRGRDRGRGGDRGRDRGGDRPRGGERGGDRPRGGGDRGGMRSGPPRGEGERGGNRGGDRDRGGQGGRRNDSERRGDAPARRSEPGPRRDQGPRPAPQSQSPAVERQQQGSEGRGEHTGRVGTRRRRRRPSGGGGEGQRSQQDQNSSTPRSNALYGPDPNHSSRVAANANAPVEGGDSRREGENS